MKWVRSPLTKEVQGYLNAQFGMFVYKCMTLGLHFTDCGGKVCNSPGNLDVNLCLCH